MVMASEFRHIVRVAGTDLDGAKKLPYVLTRIPGVGLSFASAVLRASGIRVDVRLGELGEADVQKLEDVMRNTSKYSLPPWLQNRRKDLETGQDIHLIGPDLTLKVKDDIDFMKDIKSWKGIRHSLGLKVRGQRTRTTGRKGRAVGVRKKVILEAARTAAAAAEKE